MAIKYLASGYGNPFTPPRPGMLPAVIVWYSDNLICVTHDDSLPSVLLDACFQAAADVYERELLGER